jgi:hypothetical protein
MTEQELIADLISRYPDDKNRALGVLDFVYRHGSVLDALTYSSLFWPRFIEIQDMIFVTGRAQREEFARSQTFERCNCNIG